MEILGTKWPSITSTWIQSAPAASMARISSPSLAKSAERIDGAMVSGRMTVSERASPNTLSVNGQRGPCAEKYPARPQGGREVNKMAGFVAHRGWRGFCSWCGGCDGRRDGRRCDGVSSHVAV